MSSEAPVNKPRRKRHKGQQGRLRRNVGVVIINSDGKVLAGLRAHASGDKAWQLPQGGIEGRERPLTAAYRELGEETGMQFEEVKLVAERAAWTRYFLPREWTRGRRFVGQVQKWFLFEYKGEGLPDLARAKDKEFEALDWVKPEWLQQHVIDFRKPIYQTVFEGFGEHLGGEYAPEKVKARKMAEAEARAAAQAAE